MGNNMFNEHKRNKFVFRETMEMHEIVTDIYENLMDREDKETLRLLEILAEKVRSLKADLCNKED